jgi:glucosamine-6-phosphate deaminase
MQVIIFDSAQQSGEYAADVILRGIGLDEISVLGVATGSSPLPIYSALAHRKAPRVSDLIVFALDEYVDLPAENPESYHSVVNREVTVPLGINPKNVHVPDGCAPDLVKACSDYEQRILESGGIDLQILGIGQSGHIGFNEPTSSLASRTRVKTLTQSTREDNARFFDSTKDVPHHCITQGLGTIMEARHIILIAHGQKKARAVAQFIEGPLSSMCPASILQFHPRTTVLLDESAASQLELRDYYRFVFDNRPSWQRP